MCIVVEAMLLKGIETRGMVHNQVPHIFADKGF